MRAATSSSSHWLSFSRGIQRTMSCSTYRVIGFVQKFCIQCFFLLRIHTKHHHIHCTRTLIKYDFYLNAMAEPRYRTLLYQCYCCCGTCYHQAMVARVIARLLLIIAITLWSGFVTASRSCLMFVITKGARIRGRFLLI